MSELFKWLSKPEGKRASNRSAQVFDIGVQAEQSYDSAIPMETAYIKAAVPSQAEFDLQLADPKMKSILNAGTMAGEQFRILRARLSLLQRQKGIKKLLITSCLPGEGKTFIACCLAGTLAQEPGKRVLLIDADLRMPRTAKVLGLGSENEFVGLAQILQRTHKLKESLLKLSGMDLFYLPTGEIPQNPSELLSSDNLERIIKETVELFDWVIIDSPPVLNVADPAHLAPLCDEVLMVIHANKTPAKLIQKAIETIGKNHICGILMNRAHTSHTSRYYYKYYDTNNGKGSK
jgi:capsular exopolysaccharide synthesis family protein